MQLEQKLKKTYVIYLSGKVIPGLVGLLSVPVFLRLFGEAVYGEFALVYSFFLMIITSSTGWLTQGILRFYNEATNKTLFQKTVLVTALKIAGGVFILALPIFVYFNYDNSFLMVMIGLSLILASLYTVSIAILQANFEAKKIVLADSIKAIFFILTPCLIFFVSPFITLLAGILFSFIAGVIFLALKAKPTVNLKNILHRSFKVSADSKKILKRLWVYGWPLTIWFFLASLLNISDRFIIEYYFDLEKAGEYSAIYDLFSKAFKFILAPLIAAIFPMLVKLSDEKRHSKSSGLLNKAVFYELIVFSVFLVALILFKDFLITDIFKFRNVSNVGPLVIPIFVGSFLWQFSMVLHKPLELKNATMKMVWAVLFATIINLILNFLFIPIYGYVAAAYTTIMGSVIYILSVLIINYRYNND